MSDDEIPDLEDFSSKPKADYTRTVDEELARENEKIEQKVPLAPNQPPLLPQKPSPSTEKNKSEKQKTIEEMSPLEKLKNVDLLGAAQANPALFASLSDPDLMKIFSEIASDPQKAKNHISNPKIREFMSALYGQDPIPKTPPLDPQVEALLQDTEVQKVIAKIQKEGRIDFRELAARNPVTAEKIKFLLDKGVFQTL